MSLKNDVLNELVKSDILRIISEKRTLPSLSTIYRSDESWVTGLFSVTGIPSVAYQSDVIASDFTDNISKIIACITALFDATNTTYTTNKNLVNTYNTVYDRVKTRLQVARNMINELLGYSCLSMDNGFANQTERSFCGKIGKFITLPFFINSTTVYSGNVSITEYSQDEIQFSNIGLIDSFPLGVTPSLKIKTRNISTNYRMSFLFGEQITSNAIYICAGSNVISYTVTASLYGKTVHTETGASNEIFFTFDPIKFNMLSVEMTAVNTNTDKPISLQIEDIKIFNNIQFSRTGTFETKCKEIGLTKDISELSISFNSGKYNQDKTASMLSISPDANTTVYNSVYKNDVIDISPFRNRYSYGFLEEDLVTKTISGTDFYALSVDENDHKWDMNYRQATIIYGLNKNYMSLYASGGYNNWTLVGNYYTTYLLNYYDNVYIDIGSLKCNINGKEYTGNIKIPIGISVIQVHQMNVSFDIDLFDANQTRNRGNFAYIFGGLPLYNSAGTFESDDIKTKSFDINSTTTMELGEPFIPLTEVVTDSYGNTYDLTLSITPNIEGTYTVEPYTGRIRIKPIGTVKFITVQYIPAQTNRRPAGILFNRLLTFADINGILSDDTLFGFDGANSSGVQHERFIILPKITSQTHSQILYNLNSDRLFTSVRLQMSTDNMYKTPTVDNIFISVK